MLLAANRLSKNVNFRNRAPKVIIVCADIFHVFFWYWFILYWVLAFGSLVRHCTTNCIGSTFLTGFSSSYQWQFTSVWTLITVSVGALHPGLQCWHAAASAFHQPSPTCHTAFSLNIYGRHAFSVAGPMAWNSLSDFIWDQTSSTCSRVTIASSALGVLNDYALYKSIHSLTICYY